MAKTLGAAALKDAVGRCWRFLRSSAMGWRSVLLWDAVFLDGETGHLSEQGAVFLRREAPAQGFDAGGEDGGRVGMLLPGDHGEDGEFLGGDAGGLHLGQQGRDVEAVLETELGVAHQRIAAPRRQVGEMRRFGIVRGKVRPEGRLGVHGVQGVGNPRLRRGRSQR